jgi:hypothetical protein
MNGRKSVVPKRTSKRKSAAPKRTSAAQKETFYMKVKLSNGRTGRYYKNVASLADVLIKWYKKVISSDYWNSMLSNFNISHVSDDLFKVSYTLKPAGVANIDIIQQLISDPDDDGNVPIIIKGTEYLVIGNGI